MRICAHRAQTFGWRVSRVSIVTTRFALVTEREPLLPVSEGEIATAEQMLASTKWTTLYPNRPRSLLAAAPRSQRISSYAPKISFENRNARDHVADLGIDRKIILKLILNRWNQGVDWIHLTQDIYHLQAARQ